MFRLAFWLMYCEEYIPPVCYKRIFPASPHLPGMVYNPQSSESYRDVRKLHRFSASC